MRRLLRTLQRLASPSEATIGSPESPVAAKSVQAKEYGVPDEAPRARVALHETAQSNKARFERTTFEFC